MARMDRLDLAGVTQHIVQRGNNRGACFFEDGHRRLFRKLMHQAALEAEVALHAYVLMTNHVHILGTPRHQGGMSRFMHLLGCRYVPVVNRLCGRTGTLYDGRFKSSLVQSERYLLVCYRYIELNPVRARMVAAAADYPWSSYRCNALGVPDARITPHPFFTELGDTPETRRSRYQAFVAEGVADDELDAIRAHLNQERALGSADFQAHVEALCGRRAALRPRGRPRRK